MNLDILVLIPVKPNLHPALKLKCFENGMAVQTKLGSQAQVVFDCSGGGDKHVRTLEERVAHTAAVRNRLIRQYLCRFHTHVVWIDADVVVYDPSLPLELAEMSEKEFAVTAPAVFLQGKTILHFASNTASRRWYDTAGFVKDGLKFDTGFPYFRGMTMEAYKSPVQLDGVGCFYCVPAPVYRHKGDVHASRPGFTDHLAVCEKAREMKYNVLCDFNKFVEHAWLPDYEEEAH